MYKVMLLQLHEYKYFIICNPKNPGKTIVKMKYSYVSFKYLKLLHVIWAFSNFELSVLTCSCDVCSCLFCIWQGSDERQLQLSHRRKWILNQENGQWGKKFTDMCVGGAKHVAAQIPVLPDSSCQMYWNINQYDQRNKRTPDLSLLCVLQLQRVPWQPVLQQLLQLRMRHKSNHSVTDQVEGISLLSLSGQAREHLWIKSLPFTGFKSSAFISSSCTEQDVQLLLSPDLFLEFRWD